MPIAKFGVAFGLPASAKQHPSNYCGVCGNIRRSPLRRLERDQVQARDFLEMTDVSGCHGVSSFQGACPNQQIVERDGHASGGGLSANFSNQLGDTSVIG
jgi:hypothetical protein